MNKSDFKLSFFAIATEPFKNGYPIIECITSILNVADEIIIVYGREENESEKQLLQLSEKVKVFKTNKWPLDWSYNVMTEHFNYGLQKCTGDLIIKIDIDFIFKFDDYGNQNVFRETLFNNLNTYHLMYLPKINYYPNGYVTYMDNNIYIINQYLLKKESKPFKIDRVNYCNTIVITGKYLQKNIIDYQLAPYNYDCTFMTKEQYYEKTYRWYMAYYKLFGNLDYFQNFNITLDNIKDVDKCLECVISKVYSRICHTKKKGKFHYVGIQQHPKIIQSRLQNLLDTQYGQNHFNYKLYSEVFER